MIEILNYIDGQLRPSLSGRKMENINPSRGTTFAMIPNSDEKDVQIAIEAAQKAFPAWSQMPAQERARFLHQMSALIAERHQQFVEAESMDSGKPVGLSSTVDIPRSRANLDFFADAIKGFHGESYQTDNRAINYTTYSPLGVVACISPWNLPLYLFTWKIAPALAAGNTVVAKPSELTPYTAFLLSQVAIDAKLPSGVLNVIHGTGPQVGAPLVQHPLVKAVSFTGSTATGRSIAQSTATSFKKLALEMGGKNANVIFADCDFDKALQMTVRSSFSNQGQICLCGSRILIERSIYEKFKNALVEKTKLLKQGDPMSAQTEQGAVVSETHMQKILGYIDLAKKTGGKILCGGGRADMPGELAKGYFVQPTLIEGLDSSSALNQEEIFGPVATLIPFDTEEEALKIVNSTKYGLAGSVWTQDLSKAHRFAQRVQSGIIWINTWMLRDLRTPFGGVKDSGVGREGGLHALEFMSEIKNICVGLE